MGVNRVFIVGDRHGDWSLLPDWCKNNNTTTQDILITLGDSGILYGEKESFREQFIKKIICDCPITVLDLQGNHSCPPEDREGYVKTLMKIDDDMIGMAYHNFDYPNIYHPINGNTYYIKGKTFLCVGGAGSVDKEIRQMRGWYWTEHEVINPQDMNNIQHQIHTRHFDFVITHTCPFEDMPRDLFMAGVDQSKVDNRMEHFLSKLKKDMKYDIWFFDHFHDDRVISEKMRMVHNEIVRVI